jgi:uncharacterized protein involved in response to NO
MPYGSGQVIRQAMMYAKPWQRYVIAGAMIACGVGLIAVGHVTGALLAAAGALILWRMVRYRLRAHHPTQRFVDAEEAGRNGESPDCPTHR